MNWDAIGAIAELLGAAGVIVSLVYLALQIRRSNILSVAESHRFSHQVSAASILSVAQDGELARVLREGLADRSALTADDQVRFDWFVSSLVGSMSGSVMDQMSLGLYPSDEISDLQFNLKGLLSTPGGGAWWSLYREGFPNKFQQFVVDHGLHRVPPAA
jgi:hypothetical protein